MDNIYFFNAHGKRNDLETRIELPVTDQNIYITLAYPGYTITSQELLLCLCAFKNDRFVVWFNNQIEEIRNNTIPDFKSLYLFERSIESNIIQAGWEQANKFLNTKSESTQSIILSQEKNDLYHYPDYNSIIELVEEMSKYKRPDGGINEDFYKYNTAFFITFYFRNPTFNLSIADYNYSTHIYSSVRTERSGLNPMSKYNYNLNINVPNRKFECDNNGKAQVNKLIRAMYENSLLPTKQELKGRFKLECINGEHLAISNFSINSTSQFINYVTQKLGTSPNVIFMANCSKVQGLDDEYISIVRKDSIDLRSFEDIPLEFSPLIKTSENSITDTTFDKPQNYVSSEYVPPIVPPECVPPISPPEYIPSAKPPDYCSEYIASAKPPDYSSENYVQNLDSDRYPSVSLESYDHSQHKYGSKLEKYRRETKKIYEDKKNEAKKKGSSNIIIKLDKDLFKLNPNETFEPQGGDNFFILSQNKLTDTYVKIITDGLTKLIQLNIPVVKNLIIVYGLVEYFKIIKNSINSLSIDGYPLAIDFYNQYFSRIYSDYKNELMDLFANNNNLETIHFKLIINNPTDNANFEYINYFVGNTNVQEFINNKLGLKVEPTNINSKISTNFKFSNITTGVWNENNKPKLVHPINYWFIKISGNYYDTYDIQVIETLEQNAKSKSKYLKYKKKYLNLSKQLSSL